MTISIENINNTLVLKREGEANINLLSAMQESARKTARNPNIKLVAALAQNGSGNIAVSVPPEQWKTTTPFERHAAMVGAMTALMDLGIPQSVGDQKVLNYQDSRKVGENWVTALNLWINASALTAKPAANTSEETHASLVEQYLTVGGDENHVFAGGKYEQDSPVVRAALRSAIKRLGGSVAPAPTATQATAPSPSPEETVAEVQADDGIPF